MKRYTYIAGVVTIVIVILSVIQISISNMLSTGGIHLSELQQKVAYYQRENAMLREKIYSQASLTAISEKAEKEGFAPQGKQTALIITDHTTSVALRQ